MKTLSKILLSSETPKEREQTKKNMDKLIESTMTRTETLRYKLIRDLERRNVTAHQIKVGKRPNKYPIGTKAVYVLATQGKATDSHKWKMLEFFNFKIS